MGQPARVQAPRRGSTSSASSVGTLSGSSRVVWMFGSAHGTGNWQPYGMDVQAEIEQKYIAFQLGCGVLGKGNGKGHGLEWVSIVTQTNSGQTLHVTLNFRNMIQMTQGGRQ